MSKQPPPANSASAPGRPLILGRSVMFPGVFKPVLRKTIFTLIFRPDLHNLVGCSARMEVPELINVSSRTTIKTDDKL